MDTGTDTIEVQGPDPAAVAAAEEAMREQGRPTEEPIYDDYFGFAEVKVVMLPDGRQYVEHTVLNEGQKKQYQNTVNRDVTIQKATGDAKMRMAQGDERHALLKAAITGWLLFRRDKHSGLMEQVPFTKNNLNEFLEKAPPRLIELIEKDIRQANPWLMADLSVEDIDKEIADLQDLRAKKLEEEAGKSTSSTK